MLFGANGAQIPIVGTGRAILKLDSGNLWIENAYHAPDLSHSLIPLSIYLHQGYSLSPTPSGFKCFKGAETLLTGKIIDNLLVLNPHSNRALTTISQATELHCALGHPSLPYLKAAYPHLPNAQIECPSCDLSKMHKQPFSGKFPRPSVKLEVIHMDLCGPMNPTSKGGSKYFLKIVDGFSKYRFLLTMEQKSQTFDLFQKFLKIAENQSSCTVKFVVLDNGGEFISNAFRDLFNEKGITHLTSAPYTPQQNPFAERGNCITIEKARTMLIDSGLPLQWWGEASHPFCGKELMGLEILILGNRVYLSGL